MTKEHSKPVMLRPKEVEQLYGIGRSRLYSLFSQGLPSVQLVGREGRKGTRLIRVSDLEKYLEERTVATTQTERAN
jgi:predicted DNA-binding transcriptional regulator AlpA